MRRLYRSASTDPAVNLALEELLVSQCHPDDEVLFLWQNANTVVIGRNQNPWKECNLDFLKEKGGTLVRRKSGGGAVYHDLGNLNFTFISKYEEGAISRNLALVIEGLACFGIAAAFHGRNDILADGAKISGNAYYTEDGILCHHGTLLVDVDFSVLAKMLTVSESKLKSNGVDSVKSRVINLKALNPGVCVSEIEAALSSRFLGREDWQQEAILLSGTSESLQPLAGHYRSWAWNFGESPGFGLEMEMRCSWGGLSLELQVTDGRVVDAKVFTDALEVERAEMVRRMLIGELFSEDRIKERIIERFGS